MNEKEFLNPGSAYRGKPFWAWNGKQELPELLRQIDEFEKMGFGGFFIHSRTGLITDYLGDEWFEHIRACAEYAYGKGMETWLYDEDRWPSGTCGGLVTKNPEYRAKYISEYDRDVDLPILGRFAVKPDTCEYKTVNGAGDVPAGYEYKVYAVEEMRGSEFYNGYTYLDTLSKAAVEAYIASTHELYRQKVGDMFGKQIKGIFTDEPHRGGIFTSFSVSNANRENMCPYTAGLFAAYRQHHGDDLAANLPALFYSCPNRTAVRYIETLERLFVDAYGRTYADWCRANNLIMTGHILHEDNLASQTVMSGSMMRFYEVMDYPGIDNLSMTNNCYQAAIQCVSSARQHGKKIILSELYGASGWDSGIEQLKQTGDWQAYFGINLRCPHLAWYTMRGEAKRDYPQSFLHTSLGADFRTVEDYFARLGYLAANTERVCDTLVIDPVERMWAQVRKGWIDGLTATGSQAQQIERDYTNLVKELMARHVYFDLACEADLPKAEIVRGAVGAEIRIGKARYKTVIFDGGDCRDTTRETVEKFAAAGGKVIKSASEATPDLGITADEKLAVTAFADGEDYWLVVMNFDREKDVENTRICVPLKGYNAQEYDLREGCATGDILPSANILTTVYRGSERIYRLTKQSLKACVQKPAPEAVIGGKFSYDLCEPNVLVLDTVKLTSDSGFAFDGYVLDADVYMRKNLGLPLRGTEMLQPWFKKKYCGELGKKDAQISLTFTFDAEALPAELRLAYEGDFAVTVNGKAAKKSDGRWIDTCFNLCDVAPLVKKGCNEICLSGKFDDSADLEAVYLLGDFGVKMPRTLTALPEKIGLCGFADSGLGYYSGGIVLHTDITGRHNVRVPKPMNAVAVKMEGKLVASVYPYCQIAECKQPLDVTVVLSRRNTFGPLHQKAPYRYYADPFTNRCEVIEPQVVD